MSVRTLLMGVALVFAHGAAAHAQEARLVGRVPDALRTQLDVLLTDTRAEGLPTEPLVDRALEGVAKRARPELILQAVTRLRDELRISRQALGVGSSAAEVAAGASALRAGATRADLARLRALRPQHPLTIPAGVLADLVAAGVPADTGIAAVLALASNADDADYIAFRRNVERDIALGASPASSIGARLRAVGGVADEAMGGPTSGRGNTTTSPPRKRKP
ncbi:MAG TPA: hypothetical protein VFZ04_03070 [Longimicrobiales bacterium]